MTYGDIRSKIYRHRKSLREEGFRNFKGHKNYWICLDAPTDDYATLYPEGSAIAKLLETIPIEEAIAGIVPKGEATEEIVPGGEKTALTMSWLGVLIGAVVVGSLVLLRKLKRKQH